MTKSLQQLPVTTIIRIKPKIGFEQQTIDWFHLISEKASHYKGHPGTELFEAIKDNPHWEFTIIFHFVSHENLLL